MDFAVLADQREKKEKNCERIKIIYTMELLRLARILRRVLET